MAYQLVLTDGDRQTIAFVGDRYEWSSALMDLDTGDETLDISESDAWELSEAFERDDSMFPMLDGESELYDKLLVLWEAIV